MENEEKFCDKCGLKLETIKLKGYPFVFRMAGISKYNKATGEKTSFIKLKCPKHKWCRLFHGHIYRWIKN